MNLQPEHLIEILQLDNSLELQIWDVSRLLAGDRWLVSVELRMDVPFQTKTLETLADAEKAIPIFRNIYGEGIPYRHKRERHFVDENERESVIREFVYNTKRDLIPYLSHPNFSEKLTLSAYLKLKAKNPQLFT